MGWSGSVTSTIGSSATLTSNTTTEGGYTTTSFTAPVAGVYKFVLKGSGGAHGSTNTQQDKSYPDGYNLAGGSGGSTTGYLSLKAGETIYLGVGGYCSAAYVAKASGSKLSAISKANVYFIAGGGGSAGSCYKYADYKSYSGGGVGGGTSGGAGSGGGGTQSGGGAAHVPHTDGTLATAGSYGTGGSGQFDTTHGCPAWGGRGGDGLYGGGGGGAIASHQSDGGDTSSYGYGGGGGSGYVYSATLKVNGTTYTSTTAQGGGAGGHGTGSIVVSLVATLSIPVKFNNVEINTIVFNNTTIEHLVYNGITIY